MLVIGETGAGKSTWINAVANYLKFGSLEEAVQAGGEFPIPFLLTDPQTKQKFIVLSEDDSTIAMLEHEDGKSVTQIPTEYVFECKFTGKTLHLVDTPGLLDTEDTADHSVDKQHVTNTLRLLSSYKEIHAIRIALKSTVNRLSESVKYTLTEIMKKLDTGAVNNVIFIVTYASSIMFQPRNVVDILQTFLNENKLNFPLPPIKATIYCFENGTVNYLAQCRSNISHTEYEEECAQRNWRMSESSTKQMLSYVVELKPISVANINAIYRADHTVSVLTELVLDISLCNYKNVATLERKEKEAKRLRDAIRANPLAFATDDLKQLLIRTEWKLISKPLRYKNVVCESDKCTKITVDIKVDPPQVAQYHPQICCNDCKRPWISACDKMSWSGRCKTCQCEKIMHSFKTTVQEMVKVDVPVQDETVIEKIVDSNDALKEIDRAISEYRSRVERYINETDVMLSTCAKLNGFVQQNALIAASDTDKLSERLQNKMKGCETVGKKAAAELRYLQIIEDCYQHANEKYRSNTYLSKDVNELELKGKELKDAMEMESKTRTEVIEKGRISGIVRMTSFSD